MPDGLDRISAALHGILGAWWASLPQDGWTESRLVFCRVVNAAWQDLTLVEETGGVLVGTVSDELRGALEAHQEALASPTGARPIGCEYRLAAGGELQARVNWSSRVWYGWHPGAPFEPDADPSADAVPTAEMWRRELELHPRPAEEVPAWWRDLIGAEPARPAAMPAAVGSIADALRAPVRLPGRFQLLAGAWGWDRVIESVNVAVCETLEHLADVDAAALLSGAPGARDSVAAAALARFRAGEAATWLAGTPIRLLREYLIRVPGHEPEGLGEVDPALPYAEELARSLPLKQVDAQIEQLVGELLAANLADRLGHADAP